MTVTEPGWSNGNMSTTANGYTGNLLDSGRRHPDHKMMAYGEMRAGRNGGRAEIVHVEPRMSISRNNFV